MAKARADMAVGKEMQTRPGGRFDGQGEPFQGGNL